MADPQIDILEYSESESSHQESDRLEEDGEEKVAEVAGVSRRRYTGCPKIIRFL